MKIINNNNLKEVEFGTLNEGDAFMHLGSCYIKVQCFALNKINAVLLLNGAAFSFLQEALVTPLPDAKIVL